jgi:hypothetical protein
VHDQEKAPIPSGFPLALIGRLRLERDGDRTARLPVARVQFDRPISVNNVDLNQQSDLDRTQRCAFRLEEKSHGRPSEPV